MLSSRDHESGVVEEVKEQDPSRPAMVGGMTLRRSKRSKTGSLLIGDEEANERPGRQE